MWNRLIITTSSVLLLAFPYESHAELSILGARYGIGNQAADVTAKLRENINENNLQVQSTSSLCGYDPAGGQVKELVVIYRSNQGVFKVSAREGDTLVLSENSSVGSRIESLQVTSQPQTPNNLPKTAAFLKSRKSLTTDSGVIGIPAGSRVKILSSKDGEVIVLHEKNKFTVAEDELTRDLAQVDPSKRRLSDKEIIERELVTTSTPPILYQVSNSSTPLSENPTPQRYKENPAIADINAQIKELSLQRDAIQRQMDQIEDSFRGSRHNTANNSPNYAKFRNIKKQLEDQIFALNQQRARLQ